MPEYFTPKINVAILLAPVARPSHLQGVLHWVSQNLDGFIDFVHQHKMYNFMPPMPWGSHAFDAICTAPIIEGLCK